MSKPVGSRKSTLRLFCAYGIETKGEMTTSLSERSLRTTEPPSGEHSRLTKSKTDSFPAVPATQAAATSALQSARRTDPDTFQATDQDMPHDRSPTLDATESERLSETSHGAFPRSTPAPLEQQQHHHVAHDHITNYTPNQDPFIRSQSVDVRALQEENRALRNDNEQLRALIVDRSMAADPVRPEQFYIKEFRELLADVESWVAKMDRSGGTQELSPNTANEIVTHLGAIGSRGLSSADFLRTNNTLFQRAYRIPTSRIQLERHIVAAILYDKVLAPVAFGIPPNLAVALSYILDDVEKTGTGKLIIC